MTKDEEWKVESQRQLSEWVAGRPFHLKIEGVAEYESCCPDFSCCTPEMLQPVEVRKAFLVANEDDRTKFLGGFLQGMMAKMMEEREDKDVRVYVATGDPVTEN